LILVTFHPLPQTAKPPPLISLQQDLFLLSVLISVAHFISYSLFYEFDFLFFPIFSGDTATASVVF